MKMRSKRETGNKLQFQPMLLSESQETETAIRRVEYPVENLKTLRKTVKVRPLLKTPSYW